MNAKQAKRLRKTVKRMLGVTRILGQYSPRQVKGWLINRAQRRAQPIRTLDGMVVADFATRVTKLRAIVDPRSSKGRYRQLKKLLSGREA